MGKRLVGWSLVLIMMLFWGRGVRAQTDKVEIYFIWSQSCPHCLRERVFLKNLGEKYEAVEVVDGEISSPEGRELLAKLEEEKGIRVEATPFTMVGEETFSGFLSEETTGKEIEEAVKKELGIAEVEEETAEAEREIELPIWGKLELGKLSLPVLTVAIALLDGFNPCAMWTLLFLISLLLGVKEERRRWVLGGTFILVSGLVYFLLMTAWLNLFLLLGLVGWIRGIIGVLAMAAGGYSLRDWWVNREGGCEVIDESKRRKMFGRMKEIVGDRKLLMAMGGMAVLAAAVNVIELACSAGLPAVYTQVLAMNQLPGWQYYLYLLLYIFIFMLDDMAVFVIAMVSLRAVGVESKYARWSRLIGGVIMVLIGLGLLFKPEVLMFSS